MTRHRTLAAAGALTLAAGLGPGAATASPAAVGALTPAVAAAALTPTDRVAGPDRYATAVAISRHVFPGRAASVYLVDGTASADALAAGAVTDGPVLLVPRGRPVPTGVLAEVRRLAPARVVAVGGAAVVPEATLRAAAQGRATARLAGPDRYATAAAVSRHVLPTAPAGSTVTLVSSRPGMDGVLAGQLPGTSLLTPTNGPLPAATVAELNRLRPTRLLTVGGTGTVSDATLRAANAVLGRTPAPGSRIAGADRYATSVEVARRVQATRPLPDAGPLLYVAGGDAMADTLAAGTLRAGPLVLAPRTGRLGIGTARYAESLHPARVVAIGGIGPLPDRMLRSVGDAAGGRMPTQDVVLPNPYRADGSLSGSWRAYPGLTVLTCSGPSAAGLAPGTHSCRTTPGAGGVTRWYSCWAVPGRPTEVACPSWVARPQIGGDLELHPTSSPVDRTPAAPPATRVPLGLWTTQDSMCMTNRRPGAAATPRELWAYCDNGLADSAVLVASRTGAFFRLDGSTEQVVEQSMPSPDDLWTDVTHRYWMG